MYLKFIIHVFDFPILTRSLDIVICNAGIFGAPFGLTQDNYEQTFQINYLSHMYLLLLLKPVLVVTHSTRIIIVASESHRSKAKIYLSRVLKRYLFHNHAHEVFWKYFVDFQW